MKFLELSILVIHLLCCSNFIKPAFSQLPLPCNLMYCGQGQCVTSNITLLGVDCNCNPGWKQLAIGTPCLLPNCSVDSACSQTEAPPPIIPTPKNCELIWCDMGQCVTNGTNHICRCVDGADNLFGNPELPCLSQCALGSDCKNLDLGGPGSTSRGSKGGGASSASAGTRFGGLAIVFLTAILVAWI